MQILVLTSQLLLKGHKMFNFLVAYFLKISKTLKAHISGTEADINKRQRAFFLVFNRLSFIEAGLTLKKEELMIIFKERSLTICH